MNRGILLSAEVDFMIHGVFSYEIFGQTVWITTTHVCLLIIVLALIGLAMVVNHVMKRAEEIPTGFQNVAEMIVELLDNMVKSGMGKNGYKFMNYIGTVFIFILVCNLSSLVGLRPPTADYGVTLPLGVLTFVLIHFNKFKHQKVSGVIQAQLIKAHVGSGQCLISRVCIGGIQRITVDRVGVGLICRGCSGRNGHHAHECQEKCQNTNNFFHIQVPSFD
jgi:F0F1-type ATP synthase membrane subunit a/ribosomal protein L40E